MKNELEALRSGRVNFATFARLTRLEWYRLASYLLRRWQAPASVDLDDLVQEMLLAAWHWAPQWDPKRGYPLDRFVYWNSVNLAKRWLHSQRHAYKLDDRSPSRHALCLSQLNGEDIATRLEPTVDADAEDWADRTRVLSAALQALDSELDRALLMSVVDAQGNIDKAARSISTSPRCRWLFRVEDESTARTAIRRACRRAAASLEAEELQHG